MNHDRLQTCYLVSHYGIGTTNIYTANQGHITRIFPNGKPCFTSSSYTYTRTHIPHHHLPMAMELHFPDTLTTDLLHLKMYTVCLELTLRSILLLPSCHSCIGNQHTLVTHQTEHTIGLVQQMDLKLIISTQRGHTLNTSGGVVCMNQGTTCQKQFTKRDILFIVRGLWKHSILLCGIIPWTPLS